MRTNIIDVKENQDILHKKILRVTFYGNEETNYEVLKNEKNNIPERHTSWYRITNFISLQFANGEVSTISLDPTWFIDDIAYDGNNHYVFKNVDAKKVIGYTIGMGKTLTISLEDGSTIVFKPNNKDFDLIIDEIF